MITPILPHTQSSSHLVSPSYPSSLKHRRKPRAPILHNTQPPSHPSSLTPSLPHTQPPSHPASLTPSLLHTQPPSHTASLTPSLPHTQPPSHPASHTCTPYRIPVLIYVLLCFPLFLRGFHISEVCASSQTHTSSVSSMPRVR